MPWISSYECDSCGACFHTGWGSRVYVLDKAGRRIICPHPGENSTAEFVLAEELSWFERTFISQWTLKRLRDKRMGVERCLVCMDCSESNWVDLKRDNRRCSHCSCGSLLTISEILGKACPKCKKGAVVEIPTGMIS